MFMLLGIGLTHAQENRMEICIDFRVNKTDVDSSFSDNAIRIQEIVSFLQDIRKDSTIRIVEVSFCGAASPEGSYQLNRRLAQERLFSLEQLVRREVEIPESIITRNNSYISWDDLRSKVAESELNHKETILEILDEKDKLVDYHHPNTHIDSRILKLQQLDGGKVWQQMNKMYFSRLRNACTVIVTYREEPKVVQEQEVIPEPVVIEPEPVADTPTPAVSPEEPVVFQPEGWIRQLHVKTNVLGLGLGIANAAVEVDLSKHWSFTLPVYYSTWDYFKSTIKFRTASFYPEFRYWLKPDNESWFIGAHFGFAYFNYAFDGDYRYQDHSRETPAIGGGLTIGYRTHLSHNKRWKLEFALGAGVYDLHYDKFRNKPNSLLIGETLKTWYGVDQVSVNLAYAFDLKKKGGKK